MHPLSPEQIAAARQLKAICDGLGVDLVLIGAMAYRTWIDDPNRHTYDIDIAVAIDLDEFDRLTKLLRNSGWEQEGKIEHRWTSPNGVRIDLIPAGPKLRDEGILKWPASGIRMSLIGFEHVFRNAMPSSLAPDFSLRVVPLHVLGLLKIVAYSDNPHIRQKDVGDFAAILLRYDPEEDRRFSPEVLEIGLEYDVVGAYLIGQDLIPICSAEERRLVNDFIGELRNRETPIFRLFRRSVESELEETLRSHATALIEAFALGFGSGRPRAE